MKSRPHFVHFFWAPRVSTWICEDRALTRPEVANEPLFTSFCLPPFPIERQLGAYDCLRGGARSGWLEHLEFLPCGMFTSPGSANPVPMRVFLFRRGFSTQDFSTLICRPGRKRRTYPFLLLGMRCIPLGLRLRIPPLTMRLRRVLIKN